MRYKGNGKLVSIKTGSGKINALRVKTESVLRLTETKLTVIRRIEPVVFGGHFGTQSPNTFGNYVT